MAIYWLRVSFVLTWHRCFSFALSAVSVLNENEMLLFLGLLFVHLLVQTGPCINSKWGTLVSCSRTPKQTPHFDTRSEIYPPRTLVKNKIMKTFKCAQNIGYRARKCIWHCFPCEMGYLSIRLRSFTHLKARERFRRLVLR